MTLANRILERIPSDIEDNQKATALLWLIRLARTQGIAGDGAPFDGQLLTIGRHDFYALEDAGAIETFFQYQRFMSERDLNKIKSTDHLGKIVEEAEADIKAYQEKRSYADADAGTEILVDDADDWKIAIIHNKGAACELGKGTDWCTAAPGLDYFEQYYEPDDPLFYFEDRSTENGERYQFHYGSGQFMDEEDARVDAHLALKLHELLVSALGEQINKYPIVKEARDESREMERDYGNLRPWDIWLALGG